jgi:hypothetical protein
MMEEFISLDWVRRESGLSKSNTSPRSVRLFGDFFFFLNRGRVPKDPDASFIHSGGVTFYIRAYLKKRNYNKGLTICN